MSFKKPNAIIKMSDGRIATTCYNGLDGVGIIYGEHHFDIAKDFPEPEKIIKNTSVDIVEIIKPGTWDET